jgi:glycosyltransferase involved in cell wall biosynthesis
MRARSLDPTSDRGGAAPGNLGTEVRCRVRQLANLWQEGGSQEIVDRLRRAAALRLAPRLPVDVVRQADVLAADLSEKKIWGTVPICAAEPIVVNWVTTPPAIGSGGHTTMFRLIQYLEQHGYICRIYIYDVHGGHASFFPALVKGLFPKFTGTVHDVTDGMADAHAIVATSWQTAYPVYNDRSRGKRFYLVQDFEPWFYAASAQALLAENTYKMGFHAITAGRFLAEKLHRDYDMAADAFEFGCDVDKYHLLDGVGRDGIVFYAKPDAPRRAFELGVMALRIFAERHPHLKIHLYGSEVGRLPFPYVNHGVVSPQALNALYNRCFAGLSLSTTNVSLVPHEMLAAGCIPVVNDAEHNRIVLNNPFVRYANPDPHSLAKALDDLVNTDDFASLASAASNSVSSMPWDLAGASVERSMRQALAR